MPMTPAENESNTEFNHAGCAIFSNVLGFIISHTLELGSTIGALHQSKFSYNLSLKSRKSLNPGGIINSGTMPITPAKGWCMADI
jgi:hypothetical protein